MTNYANFYFKDVDIQLILEFIKCFAKYQPVFPLKIFDNYLKIVNRQIMILCNFIQKIKKLTHQPHPTQHYLVWINLQHIIRYLLKFYVKCEI